MSKSNFEKVISEQGQLVYSNVGDSMYPLIIPRDLLVIKKPSGELKKFDVPLYKRKNGQYVLHRIVGIDDEGFTVCGDNRSQLEFGVKRKQIIGVLTDIIRDGETIPATELTRKIKLKNASDLMYLISCALNDEKPDVERCRAMYIGHVLRLAERHSLLSVAAFALEKLKELPHGLDQVKKKAIRKIALFDIERAKILSEFEKLGISYCPLKGIILKDCYPMIGMREMSDNDILCDPSRMDDIKELMERLGYECTSFGEWNHDTYSKPPTIEFEMHRSLFFDGQTPELSEYYSDIRDRLIGEGCALRMTDADFYIYILCHMYKHHVNNGTGLRNLPDIVAYTRCFDLEPMREYIDRELEKLGILDFERSMRELAEGVMSGAKLDSAQEKLLIELADSGVYGNRETAEYNSTLKALDGGDDKRSKLRFFVRRVFPDEKYLKKAYPAVYRHRALYPFLIVYRPIKGALTHPKRIIREAKKVARFKK